MGSISSKSVNKNNNPDQTFSSNPQCIRRSSIVTPHVNTPSEILVHQELTSDPPKSENPTKSVRVTKRSLSSKMSAPSNNWNDDCPYYFRPEGCLIGDGCPFRHSEAAKGSFEVCPNWVLGGCDEWILCPLRHMAQERIDEDRIKFYPEESQGGEPAAGAGGGNQEVVQSQGDDSEGAEGDDGPQRKRARASIDEHKGPECPICMEDFTTVTKWMAMVCGHILCEGCSTELWGKKGVKTCPICKKITRLKPKPIFFN